PNNFSIEAWVKLKDITRNYQQIFDAGNADNNHMVSIGTAGTTGRLFISIPTAANGNASNDIWDTQVTPRIANNTWFHIVYVKKGVNVKLYLNGTKVIEDNTSVISYNDSITRVYFGATNFGNQSMLGQLDECRIWKKALTEAEIARYKTVFLTPQDDSLYVYLPLHGSLIKDTSIPAGTIIKNSATGASALTRPITVGGNGMKMSRDPNRQIVYGTHDTTTTLTNPINVVTHFYNQPITSDSNTTAVKFGNHWATENKKIPSIFVLGTIQVNKTGTVFNPDPLYVYYAPTAITYNYLNTFNIPQSTTPYTTNKPLVYTNYDSTNLVFSISPAYTGISIDATTGIITIDADMVYSAHGKHVKPTIIAQSGLGSTSTEVTINIIPTNIIGYNNTSVCLPQTNGQDYIRIPSLDLSNSNFAIDIWFKLIGSPTGNKRIFDFSRAAANQGLILFFSLNKLKLGAFEQDTLINLGNADTVLKNGVNEWNKYSIFYNATTKTYYVYINGVLKKMATAATDKYIIPLLSNFLANNNYLDPVTDGYFREFKIYKNISYTDFIKNLSYNILPNRPDNSLYYYLPLSNNVNNSTYNGNITINNNTELTNKALMYNPNAPNTNAVISTANNRAFYYGDSINQIITGEFID
ncbi:MAG: LamG domain-containing protein, partial [Sediminibacterium sp.]|nr:LamG domain-containing protein [Sediminibacterium sp.]